jgi:hypothetical protein
MNNIIKISFFLVFLSVNTQIQIFGCEADGTADLMLNNDTTDIFINGWEYKIVSASDGHPFAFSKIWNFDTIFSSLGIRTNYLMNYDIYQDALVIQSFINNQPYQITLNSGYIKSFLLEGINKKMTVN